MSTNGEISMAEKETAPISTHATKEEETFGSRVAKAIQDAKNPEVKRLTDYIGPTGFWLFSYYVASIFIMICVNIARVGWSGEAIFAAPSYFAQLFINYGLNAGKVDENTFEKIEFSRGLESASWFFAPWIIYTLGIMFVMLPGSGYPMLTGDYDYTDNFLYFHERTVALNADKSGGFYFLIVWLPLILATLAGALISKRLFKKENRSLGLIKLVLFNLVVGFFVGLQMGLMTGTYRISILGSLRTIFGVSEDNVGVIFTGHYHPNAIYVTSWFINLFPAIITAIWYVFYAFLEDKILELIANRKNPALTS